MKSKCAISLAFKCFMNLRAHEDLVKDLGKDTDIYSFRKDRVIREASRVLLRPETELENLFVWLTKLKVFITVTEESEINN